MAMPRVPSAALKLTYFDFTGRAEPIRLAFVLGGVPFEDDRISFAELAELKPSLPNRQVPVLTIGGRAMYAQSHAILRYAGVVAGLYPTEDPVVALAVDEIDDSTADILELMLSTRLEGDKDKKRARCDELVHGKLKDMLGFLDARIEQCRLTHGTLDRDGKGGPWVLHARLTTADLAVHNLVGMTKLGWLEFIPTDLCDSFPRLVAIHLAIATHPTVVAWKSSRRP
ncbi:hypothetical protein H310_02705 [Aphanomyces invadans]|uniref:GST N-terminal domain-containing protein n=1 Tax=Aphanomyces invadans TaxID=157072 RepID=A0A024UJJ5_9STRA|nr:hypothetical protein H310_02705 [Aphanomyces invadans]ETW06449.1 hypothetical protein H310_02705 [Aphanomyces invadans]RHY33120.1 hypothetical protein DYB32_001962 [Aphanomyces invadans]|eukprot:XP_008864524.1 hypothetical protein H310_02705 [Aphanomyces invadans]